MEKYLQVCFLLIASAVESTEAFASDRSSSDTWLDEHTVTVCVVSIITLVLLSVFLLSLCGGCTEMEVGTDNHPAAGGGNRQSGYSGIVTDTNTQVMHSTHSFGETVNPNSSQGLPYSLTPSGVTNVQGFTGYQTAGQGQPSYQGRDPYNSQPYGSQGYSPATGYTTSAQAPSAPAMPGAHRSAAEPPPPSYNESVRQNYSWR